MSFCVLSVYLRFKDVPLSGVSLSSSVWSITLTRAFYERFLTSVGYNCKRHVLRIVFEKNRPGFSVKKFFEKVLFFSNRFVLVRVFIGVRSLKLPLIDKLQY